MTSGSSAVNQVRGTLFVQAAFTGLLSFVITGGQLWTMATLVVAAAAAGLGALLKPTPQLRLAVLGFEGFAVFFGVLSLVAGHHLVPGTIVGIGLLIRLANAPVTAFTGPSADLLHLHGAAHPAGAGAPAAMPWAPAGAAWMPAPAGVPGQQWAQSAPPAPWGQATAGMAPGGQPWTPPMAQPPQVPSQPAAAWAPQAASDNPWAPPGAAAPTAPFAAPAPVVAPVTMAAPVPMAPTAPPAQMAPAAGFPAPQHLPTAPPMQAAPAPMVPMPVAAPGAVPPGTASNPELAAAAAALASVGATAHEDVAVDPPAAHTVVPMTVPMAAPAPPPAPVVPAQPVAHEVPAEPVGPATAVPCMTILPA